MFNDQYDGLLRDYAEFPDEQSFLADVHAAAGLKEEPMTNKQAHVQLKPDAHHTREELEKAAAGGHGTHRYSCGHEERCRCRHNAHILVTHKQACHDCRQRTKQADDIMEKVKARREKLYQARPDLRPPNPATRPKRDLRKDLGALFGDDIVSDFMGPPPTQLELGQKARRDALRSPATSPPVDFPETPQAPAPKKPIGPLLQQFGISLGEPADSSSSPSVTWDTSEPPVEAPPVEPAPSPKPTRPAYDPWNPPGGLPAFANVSPLPGTLGGAALGGLAGYFSGQDDDEEGQGGTRGRNALLGALAGGGLGLGGSYLLDRYLRAPKQASLNNRSSLGQSTAGESGLQIYMAPWSVNGDDAWGEVGSYYGDNPPRPQRKLVTVGEKHAAELGEFGRGFVQEFIGRSEGELYRAAKLASDYAPEIAEELAPLLKQAGIWDRAVKFLGGRSTSLGLGGKLSRNVVGPTLQGSLQTLQSVGRAVPGLRRVVPRGMGNVATGSRGFVGNAAREAGGIGTAMGLGHGVDQAADAMGIEGGLGFAEMAGLLRTGHGLNRLGAGVNAGKKPLDPLIVGRHNAQGNPALQAAFDKQIRNRSLGNAGRTLGGNAMQAAGQGIVGHSVGEGLGVSADMLTRNIGLGDYHLRDRLPQVFGGMGATRGLFSGLGNRLTQGERGSPLERLVGDYIPGALNVSHPGWVTTGGGLATAGLAARAGQTALAKQTDELVESEPFNQAMAELRTAESQLAQLQQAGAGPAELAQAQQSLEAAQGKVQQFTEGKADMVAPVAQQLSDVNASMKDIGLHKLHTLTQQLDPFFEEVTGHKLSEFDLRQPEQQQQVVGLLQQQLQTAEQAQAAVMQAAEDLKKPLLEMAAGNPEYQQRLAAMGPEELAAELGGLVGQAQQMGVQLDENGKLAMPGGGLLAGIPFLEDMGPWGTLAVLLGAGMVLGGLMSGGGEGGGNAGLMGGLALGGLALGAPYLMDWWNSQGTAAPPAEAGAVPDEQLSQAPPPPGPQGQAGSQPGFAEHGDEAAVAAPPPR